MSIENIETEVLKEFAKKASLDGWRVIHEHGILKMSKHRLYPDYSICWSSKKNAWDILDKESKSKKFVSRNELQYPASILF